ncbi:MAG TPA: hypothetical protein VLK89_04150 [Solirubrobacterales bacterium]|nr:hypothetical protein [Solirubrobacterales bacterium]
MISKRHERIARFVTETPIFEPLFGTVPPAYRQPYPTAEQLASDLLADSEFDALRLGTWLRSPDGELIAEAVALAIDPAFLPEYDLAVEALRLAAAMKYEGARPKRQLAAFGLAILIFAVGAASPSARPAAA